MKTMTAKYPGTCITCEGAKEEAENRVGLPDVPDPETARRKTPDFL